MKKIIIFIFLLLILSGCTTSKENVVNILNWSSYIPDEVIRDFEEKYGIKVNYSTYSSNEECLAKLSSAKEGTYDLIFPSDYMVELMIKRNLIQKLDKDKITCMDELVDAVKGLPYDPNNDYSIPYFWGTVGIVYDKTKVSEADLEKEGYNIFLDTKYKGDIYLYDSERDSFMMALKALGYSMNTKDEKELEEAYKWLVKCV